MTTIERRRTKDWSAATILVRSMLGLRPITENLVNYIFVGLSLIAMDSIARQILRQYYSAYKARLHVISAAQSVLRLGKITDGLNRSVAKKEEIICIDQSDVEYRFVESSKDHFRESLESNDIEIRSFVDDKWFLVNYKSTCRNDIPIDIPLAVVERYFEHHENLLERERKAEALMQSVELLGTGPFKLSMDISKLGDFLFQYEDRLGFIEYLRTRGIYTINRHDNRNAVVTTIRRIQRLIQVHLFLD